MHDPPAPSRDTVDEVTLRLLRWEELRRQGREPSVPDLCAGRPDLVNAVEHRVRLLKAIEAALDMPSLEAPPRGRPPHPARHPRLRGAG